MPPEFFRTPDDRFANLPGWDLEPRYREWEGLRLAYYDTGGDGPVVVLCHGEPTWSYLWRKVIPPLVEAGFRCVLQDMPGFGRSDKPTEFDWYTYDLHTDALKSLIEQLDLREINFVVHDWGGPVGLRTATELADRVATTVAMDTGVFTGTFKMSDNWQTFAEFVERTEDLPIGFLVKGAVAREMPDEVFAAYEAPFPEPAAKAGARAFPPMIPREETTPDARTGQKVLADLAAANWPKLVLWADKDPVLPTKLGEAFAAASGSEGPIWIENAGHFLQEDAGGQIGEIIADWLKR